MRKRGVLTDSVDARLLSGDYEVEKEGIQMRRRLPLDRERDTRTSRLSAYSQPLHVPPDA